MTAMLHTFAENAEAAQRLADRLSISLGIIDTHRFPDGECLVRAQETARTAIVYRSLNQPNEKIIQLLLAADALRRNGARRLVLVAPYLPYMRQDKAFRTGEPVSQRVVSGLLDDAFDRIVTVDPHLHRTHSLQSIFRKAACTHVRSAEALVPVFKASLPEDAWVVGPDSESAAWVQSLAEPLSLQTAVLQKQRRGDRKVEISVPPDAMVTNCPVLLIDDICSSGATIVTAIHALKAAGAASITVYVTHALCSDTALDELMAAGAERLISSDSCPHRTNAVHLAPVLAEALAGEC
jgi:ribose-phosphate pyrophosphokinase